MAPEDCTGCGSCVYVCPAHGKDAQGQQDTGLQGHQHEAPGAAPGDRGRELRVLPGLPETDPSRYNVNTVKGSQFRQPLFEYHSACAGCGETPYIRLLTQLFGDRLYIANATGCTSIYGGNLPTHPYTTRADGRGPDVVQFALRGQRGVRLRHEPGSGRFYGQAVELLNELMQEPAYKNEAGTV